MLKAKVHSARIPDADGIRLLLEEARVGLSRLSHLWVDAGYQGRGKRWADRGGDGLERRGGTQAPKADPREGR